MKKKRRARTGDVVVAPVWGEPTVKRLIRSDGVVILRSTSPAQYPDVVVKNAENARVQGTVVMVVPPTEARSKVLVRAPNQEASKC